MDEVIRPGKEAEDRFDRSRRVEWLDLDAVFSTRVLMVGAGALGNEVGKNLALSGFRRVTIVDMDRVSLSNLNRCLFFEKSDPQEGRFKSEALAKGMEGIGEDMCVDAITTSIQEVRHEAFQTHDIVLGCLDNIIARMYVNSCAYRSSKPYIDGGMDGLTGKVMVVRPPDGPCLQCGMNASHARVAGTRFSCTGADVVFHEPRLAAEITTTSVVSAVMVREALKLVSGRQDMSLSNLFYYDGGRNTSEELEISLNPSCPVHTI